MRIIQKSLVDYNAIDSLIQVQRFIGNKQNATLLFNAKQALARCYGRLAANLCLFPAMRTVLFKKLSLSPMTTSCNASSQAAITYNF